jgi:hypothetical protein
VHLSARCRCSREKAFTLCTNRLKSVAAAKKREAVWVSRCSGYQSCEFPRRSTIFHDYLHALVAPKLAHTPPQLKHLISSGTFT